MNMAKILKNAGIFVLCMAMCLAIALPTFAAENAAVGAVKHYYVNGETETYVEGFSKVGDYKAKADVYNYDTVNTMTAVLVTGVFNNSGVIENVVTDRKTAIANGAKVTLENEVTLTTTDKTLKSYLWKSIDTLVPLEGVAPAAPTNVVIDTNTITNSTVDITWDAASDSNAIAYYNVYRNGKFVGSTFAHGDVNANDNSFKDVGIEHNTEVSYTVTAVDVTGNESAQSEASAAATTDDIARLWLGAAASKIEENATSASLTADDYNLVTGNGNIQPVHIMLSDGTDSTTIKAVNEDYEFTSSQKLGLNALEFGAKLSRVLATIPEGEFLTALKNDADKEMRVILNYYDYPATADSSANFNSSIGKRVAAMVRYQMSSGLSGGTGSMVGSTNRWHTSVLTVPLNGNTSGKTYSDVYSNRQFGLQAISSAGSKIGNTDGKSAMLAIGNGTIVNPVYISKIDIAGSDYVPYGAVLDFEKQEDTQFIHFWRRHGWNQGEIKKHTDAEGTEKKAIKLDADVNATKYLKLGFDSDYINSSDSHIVIRITYLDNFTDENRGDGLQVIYESANGNNGDNIIMRANTGKWQTKEFIISDAALANGTEALQLNVPGATGDKAWYVSRIEVIKR